MFMIMVDYPKPEEEMEVVKRGTTQPPAPVRPVLGAEHILYMQNAVRRLPVADHVIDYAQKIVGATRGKTPQGLDFCKKMLSWGAGPRATLNLVMAAKARAILQGQVYVSCEDIAAVALPIMRHRIIPNFTAQSEGVTSDDITRKILKTIPQSQGE
jgi:MoxR-like ATPase